MALSAEDKKEIMEMLKEMFGDTDEILVEPEPVPEFVAPGYPLSSGPLVSAISGVSDIYHYALMVSDFSANIDNRFRRADVYELMARIIRFAIDTEADWVKGSAPSWRFTKEAFLTRSSELLGDAMTTEFPVFVSVPSSNGIDYGVTAHFFNMMTTVIRRLVGQLVSQEGDRDLGPNGELLTGGECVRLAYTALDAVTDMRIVPGDADSSFMKVRMECYNQYKAMGEGVFGPWAHPGGPVPWSWAG